jgi:hypothetical protein
MTVRVARILAAPVTAAVLLAGIWVTGGLLTNDFALAMWLTGGWIALAGVVALGVAARSRAFRWPVLGAYVATAGVVAIYLGSSTFTDNVVNEEVARAGTRNGLIAEGRFESVRHSGRGVAQAIELAGGGRVLTLTRFDVDNGPDLRVYLVAGPATTENEVDDHVDLGGLKGNRGNQQYTIPAGTDLDRYSTVVIWCRAFSVLFARAELRT